MATTLPKPRALPRPPPLSAEVDLQQRGFAFERVHAAYAEPVRLRLRGQSLGVFPTRGAAAQTIKNNS